MKQRLRLIVLGAGAVLFGAGLAFNSFDLVFVAALAGVTAVALPAVAGVRKALEHAPWGGRPRVHHLEERLSVAEDELAAATRELAALREQQEFDLKLRLAREERLPPPPGS